MTPWAVYDPSGDLRYIGLHSTERDCWTVFLGWPSEQEIKEKIDSGWMAAMVKVTIDE